MNIIICVWSGKMALQTGLIPMTNIMVGENQLMQSFLRHLPALKMHLHAYTQKLSTWNKNENIFLVYSGGILSAANVIYNDRRQIEQSRFSGVVRYRSSS